MQTLGNIMKFESKDERIFMSIELSNTACQDKYYMIICYFFAKTH